MNIKKCIRYFVGACLSLLSFLVIGEQSFFPNTSLQKPKFAIIPVLKAPVEMLRNSISFAQYTVTNQTTITRTLTTVPIPGIQQLTGANLCSNPFTLAPNQSCRLNLQLNASQMPARVLAGPVICKTKSASDNTPDPFLCSQPGNGDMLTIEVLPCTVGLCLPSSKELQLRAITRQYQNVYGVPGIVSGLWIPEQGQLIIEDGFADLTNQIPISRSDHFRIGSITKSFTVTVLLQLVQESLLQLTTPISDYLAGIQNGNASMEQAAAMTSGIFNYTEDANFVTTFFSDLTRVWSPMELVAVGNSNLPYFPPGTNWHYSNTNTIILGIIIEMITGRTIAEEINQRLLVPLNLTHTFYFYTIPIPQPFAHGYAFTPLEDVTNTSPTAAAASGAMVSRLEDLHVWAKALGQGQLLSSTMQAIRLASLQPIVFFPCPDTIPGRGPVACPEYDQYGMGIGEINGWIGHTGEFVGYSSLVMYNPSNGAVIVILMNLFGVGQHLPTKLFQDYLTILA